MNASKRKRYTIIIEGETTQVGTANELAIALDVLQGQHDRSVLDQLAPHLADIVDGPIGFAMVLKSLSPDDQLYLLRALGDRLAGVIREARYLRDLLATMSVVEVEQCLLETLGSQGLRALIVTSHELAQVLEWLYGQCDRQVLDLMGAASLSRLIRSGHDLSLVLNSLDEAGQEDVIGKIGWGRIVELVRDGRELAQVLRALPPVHSLRLLDHYSRDRLVDLIGNERDWTYLYHRLEPAEADRLQSQLGVERHAE